MLTVDGAGIADLAGNAAAGSVSEDWVMDIVAPLAPTNLKIGRDNGISVNRSSQPESADHGGG